MLQNHWQGAIKLYGHPKKLNSGVFQTTNHVSKFQLRWASADCQPVLIQGVKGQPGIYLKQNTDSSLYVGKSETLSSRLSQHKNDRNPALERVFAILREDFVNDLAFAEAYLFTKLEQLGYSMRQQSLSGSLTKYASAMDPDWVVALSSMLDECLRFLLMGALAPVYRPAQIQQTIQLAEDEGKIQRLPATIPIAAYPMDLPTGLNPILRVNEAIEVDSSNDLLLDPYHSNQSTRSGDDATILNTDNDQDAQNVSTPNAMPVAAPAVALPSIQPTRKLPEKTVKIRVLNHKKERIPGETDTDVYVNVLTHIGLERVKTLGLTVGRKPLIEDHSWLHGEASKAHRTVGNYRIRTHSNSANKMLLLQALNQRLELNLTVEWIPI